MSKSLALGLLGLLTLTGAGFLVNDADKTRPLNIGSNRELFVDGILVDRLDGKAELRLHRPVPREVVMVHDAPWEGNATAYHSVFKDGDRYRMYYRAWNISVKGGQLSTSRDSLCYAESDDGINWRKPELGLHEFQGSKANNMVISTPMAAGLQADVGGPAVFRDENPNSSPDARYKTFLISKKPLGMVPFKSPDGIHWSPMTDAPVITHGAFDSQNLAFWDSLRGEYRAYWRYFTEGVTDADTWKPAGIRAIRTAVSKDLLQWKNEADLTYVDSPPEQLYENGVSPYHRAPHLLIGFPVRYVDRARPTSTLADDNQPADQAATDRWPPSLHALPDSEQRKLRSSLSERYGSALTEALVMASRDGVNFKRWNEAFIPPGLERSGTWNYGQLFVAWHLVETKSALQGAPNELSLYATEGYWTGAAGTALRRYTLRLDGFVSARAPAGSGGAVTTKPLIFSGTRLYVNFATSAAGGMRIELQDPTGKPLPGFTGEDCDELFGDSLDRLVTWKGNADVAAVAGQPVRVRVLLQDADLFAFQFRE
jgi:hypothetical protein